MWWDCSAACRAPARFVVTFRSPRSNPARAPRCCAMRSASSGTARHWPKHCRVTVRPRATVGAALVAAPLLAAQGETTDVRHPDWRTCHPGGGCAGGGVVTGIMAGLFGIGGGAVIVPVLYEVF